ncbi:helix-turn-helix domain-containing protein [Actinomadura gamaensis]|uniref:Helix-turn-helix domain-containing protein n=1 Tax=Actinomadura gamaensis TaxID=1763541 RepID=A0ABV9TV41_9ACTN
MTAWSEYTTGERVKILRGTELTQAGLAEAAGVSLALVQKLEQGGTVKVASLISVGDALGTDVSVLLGQQAPRRSMSRAERTALRTMSLAIHDSALTPPDASVEPPPLADLKAALARAWDGYWRGDYLNACAIAPRLIAEARAFVERHEGRLREQGLAVLADTLQIAGCVANLFGKPDLAYAAITHALRAADGSGDVLLTSVLNSALAWIHLRDGRVERAVSVSEQAAVAIEPSFGRADPDRLSVFGNLMLRAAVSSARCDDRVRAEDYLSQAHAAAARLGVDGDRYHTLFGPTTARTHSLEIHLAFGDVGKALDLIAETRLPRNVPLAAWGRHQLNVALAYSDARRWDAATDTLLEVCDRAPNWIRHQVLAGAVAQRIGDGSTANLRKVTQHLGVPLLPR